MEVRITFCFLSMGLKLTLDVLGHSSYFLIGELKANVTKEKLFLVNMFF